MKRVVRFTANATHPLHTLRFIAPSRRRLVIQWSRCFSELREILELDLNDVPDHTTIYKSFDRFNMTVWRALLRVSAEQLPQSGHVALDSTFFERGHASSYYLQQSDRDVQTLKVTTLTDTESLAVLDLQCSVEWKHDTRLGPQVVRRNADDLLSVAVDKGFHDWMGQVRVLHTRRRSTRSRTGIVARNSRPQRIDPGEGVLPTVDVRDILLDDEALARLCRASAVLVSGVPRDCPDFCYLEHRTNL